MLTDQVTCSPQDGDEQVQIGVVRKSASAFATDVYWSAHDGDAVHGKHYNNKKGELM